MDEFPAFEFEKISRFNMSIATLERINSLLCGINTALISGEILLYWRGITALYIELDTHIKPDERIIAKEKYMDNIKIDVMKGKVIYTPKDLEFLHEFNKWIRIKLNDNGLLIAKENNPHFAVMK